MASYENFYAGANNGLDPDHGSFVGYRTEAAQLGIPTDPFVGNQLKAVSDKIATGVKTIEVSGITPALFESLPEQALTEINRLKKLAGVDLTFHGPLIEPTGVTKQGWDDTQRQHAERQMWSAVERSHKMDPKGNLVVTFHSSNGLPDPETVEIDEKTGEKRTTAVGLVDENTGQFRFADVPKHDHFHGQGVDIDGQVKKMNKEDWFTKLQNLSFHAHAGGDAVRSVLSEQHRDPEVQKLFEKLLKNRPWQEIYKMYLKGKEDEINSLAGPELAGPLQQSMRQIGYGDSYLRDSYQALQNLFNQAYDHAVRYGNTENKKKLDKFKKSMEPHLSSIEDPANIDRFASKIDEGVQVLRSIDAPQTLRPLKEFAIDKASDTFSNLALRSYDKFKDTAPIISIENPPAGSGLSKGDDLRDLVEASRNKFIENAQDKFGLSKSEAKLQAEKLLGVTWDVGHINMIRKMGFSAEDTVKETKKVAPYVKHVHLSDNFGLEHTELPMGMGNVPTKKHLELISKYNAQAKKIAETGNWFSPQQGLGFQNQSPVRETFEAFGAPIYASGPSPYWNQQVGTMGGYFSGRGQNPDMHHSIYGAGFSNLPIELGGQMEGQSRLSGAPIE